MSKRSAAILLFDCPEAVEASAINCGSLLGVLQVQLPLHSITWCHIAL